MGVVFLLVVDFLLVVHFLLVEDFPLVEDFLLFEDFHPAGAVGYFHLMVVHFQSVEVVDCFRLMVVMEVNFHLVVADLHPMAVVAKMVVALVV